MKRIESQMKLFLRIQGCFFEKQNKKPGNTKTSYNRRLQKQAKMYATVYPHVQILNLRDKNAIFLVYEVKIIIDRTT